MTRLVFETSKLRFGGRHRCPRCRMPLRAEELACPICALQLVFIRDDGQVMVEMIAADAPGEWTPAMLEEYLAMLRVEGAGDMYLTGRYFPTRPQLADLEPTENGEFRVRLSNRVALTDIGMVRE
jgi:predicted amidophosphoribosyltransferase